MADQLGYRSPLQWNPARSDTLVVACADGRWRPHIDDFVANHLRGDPTSDLLSVPGGIEPVTLFDLIPKDFNFIRRRLEMVVRTHGIRRLVAIAHQDCGWYRERKIGSFKVDLRSRQVTDLRQARKRLSELFGDLTIETYFARLDGEPPRVVFEAV